MIVVLLTALAAPQGPEIATVQTPPDVHVTNAVLTDVDGDGRDDLVLTCRREVDSVRSVQVHKRQPRGPAFTSKPMHAPIPIDDDVIAFTYCDCRNAPGRELVLLAPEQAILATRGSDGELRIEALCEHRLVWPAPDKERVLPLVEANVDFDGDGQQDLLLPQPDGWSLWRQDNGAFTRVVSHELPRWRSAIFEAARGGALQTDGRAASFRLGGVGGPSSLVSAGTRTPACAAADYDGDGRLDLITWRNAKMFVSMQGADGKAKMVEQALPLPEDRLKLLDPAFNVQFEDLNGDGRRDLLLTTSARRDDDVEARVDWFFTRPDGTRPDKRDGRLRLQALAIPVELLDADGDGTRDLVCVSVRTSAMRRLSPDKAAALDAQLTIFPGSSDGFARPALLNRALPLAAGKNELAAPFVRLRAGKALMRVSGSVVQRPLTSSGGRLRLGAKDASVAVDDAARVVHIDDGELLVILTHEVRHVRFR